MRVLIVSTGLPSRRYPLNGIFAFDQAKALAAQGIDVTFFSVDLRSVRKLRKPGISTSVRDCVKCFTYSVPLGPARHSILNRIGCKLSDTLFRKAFRNQSYPDVIHTHFAASYGAFLSSKYHIPFVITEHSSRMNRSVLPTSLLNETIRTYSNAARIIAVSSALSLRIKQHTTIPSVVIPNVIDVHLFFNVQKEKHKGFNFVTTSNLIPLKRTSYILSALSKIRGFCPDVFLTIIGDGPEMKNLQRQARELKIQDIVSFQGVLPRSSIADIYRKMDCFVLVSSSETFGVAYAEANAAGLPIIATRCGGPEDFVTEKNGVLIEVDDQDQLSEAMHYMVDNAGKYSSNTIREYVQSRFSPEVIAREIIEIYTEIIKK